jgi:hypothetical protein
MASENSVSKYVASSGNNGINGGISAAWHQWRIASTIISNKRAAQRGCGAKRGSKNQRRRYQNRRKQQYGKSSVKNVAAAVTAKSRKSGVGDAKKSASIA